MPEHLAVRADEAPIVDHVLAEAHLVAESQAGHVDRRVGKPAGHALLGQGNLVEPDHLGLHVVPVDRKGDLERQRRMADADIADRGGQHLREMAPGGLDRAVHHRVIGAEGDNLVLRRGGGGHGDGEGQRKG